MEKATKGLILEFVKRLNQNTELGKLEDDMIPIKDTYILSTN